jgi:general secretion pathway protein C
LFQDYLIKLLADIRTRYLILFVLLPVLAYQLSILFWNSYPISTMGDMAMQSQAVTNNQLVTQTASFRQQAKVIKQGFLFGEAAVNIATTVEVEQAPETQLKYKLRGVYYSDIKERSSAIVEIKVNESKLYQVDDELADNIVVAAIEREHILINRYGKLERLNLEKPIAINQDDINTNTGSTPGSLADSTLLRNYRQRYASNPMALAQRFQSIPVQENGKNIGFKLKALGGENLLGKLNFQDSDVFTKINGIGLDKPFQALEALKSLTTANSVTVTILRNGREETLDFNL